MTPSLKVKPQIYGRLNLHELILVSIYLVAISKETCTFERLVAECFNNFPKAFSFKRYPKWPDATKFDRPLRTLREKGLITGSPRDAFALNQYGERKAKSLLGILKTGAVKRRPEAVSLSLVRSADDRIIDLVRKSAPYLRFSRNPDNLRISEQELRNLLRCTLETPSRVVKQNLEYFLHVAREYGEKAMERFLLSCKRKIPKD